MGEWRRIREFPRYSVNEDGRIRNDSTDRVMKRFLDPAGQLTIGLIKNNQQYRRKVSRIVCETFVPNPRPEYFNTPIHLSGDLSDCSSSNLAWRPRWFAKKYTRQFRIDLPDRGPLRNNRTGEEYDSIWELVSKHGLLYMDIVVAIPYAAPIFPLMEQFSWVD